MKEQFHEGLMAKNRDPVDAPDQGFDWEQLYQCLNQDATSGDNDPKISETVVRVLQMLLPPPSNRRIQPESLGMRLIALAWVLSPAYFEGSPSVRRLARRCGVRIAALANYTGLYSRLLRWRNRGQSHAWNWLRHGTPSHRGGRLKRNVPASRKGREAASTGPRQAAALAGRVAPITKSKRTRPGRE